MLRDYSEILENIIACSLPLAVKIEALETKGLSKTLILSYRYRSRNSASIFILIYLFEQRSDFLHCKSAVHIEFEIRFENKSSARGPALS